MPSCLKSVPSNTGITEDILGHDNVEISHDSPVINLLETAWANSLTFNAQRFALKKSLKTVYFFVVTSLWKGKI